MTNSLTRAQLNEINTFEDMIYHSSVNRLIHSSNLDKKQYGRAMLVYFSQKYPNLNLEQVGNSLAFVLFNDYIRHYANLHNITLDVAKYRIMKEIKAMREMNTVPIINSLTNIIADEPEILDQQQHVIDEQIQQLQQLPNPPQWLRHDINRNMDDEQQGRGSKIHSVLFDKAHVSKSEANRWLKVHNIKPIKPVDVSENYLRYRINSPSGIMRTKQIAPWIKFVFSFSK